MKQLLLMLIVLFAAPCARPAIAQDADRQEAAARGYRFLTESPVLASDFDQDTVDALWTIWPKELRERAEKASPDERRRMTFERYGLTVRPNDDSGKPLQYVVSEQGQWTMNCFACHGGLVYGKPTPGAPNNRYALSSLTEEVTMAKATLGKLPGTMEVGSLFIPLGSTNGTTNAVVFGMALMRAVIQTQRCPQGSGVLHQSRHGCAAVVVLL